MRKIIIWGYWKKNLGDDLFLKLFSERYQPVLSCKPLIFTERKYAKYYERMGYKVISTDSLRYRIANKICERGKGISFSFFLCNKKTTFICLGGSLFAEKKGDSAERKQIKNLGYAVEQCDKKFVLGSNFGPFQSEWFWKSYSGMFHGMTDVCFRDKMSSALFQGRNIRYAPDIVMSGNYKKIEKEQRDGVGISVINVENRSDLKQYLTTYETTLSLLCDKYLSQGVKVYLFSFCEYEGDLEACFRIKKQCTGNTELLEVVSYEQVDDFLLKMSECKKMYATRFHAVILSLCFELDVVPLIYNEKIKYALESYCECYNAFELKDVIPEKLDVLVESTNNYRLYCNIYEEAMKQFRGLDKEFLGCDFDSHEVIKYEPR